MVVQTLSIVYVQHIDLLSLFDTHISTF